MRALWEVMISRVVCLLVTRTSSHSRMMWHFEDTLAKPMPSKHFMEGNIKSCCRCPSLCRPPIPPRTNLKS
ncbi:hypothetical protein AMTRI_Chr12g236390 [Amborella trichopoda]